MRYFIDTEFNEHAEGGMELISIGVVPEKGEGFYAVSSEFTTPRSNPWLMTNVISNLVVPEQSLKRLALDEIAERLTNWITEESPIFYGYFSAYDWVMLCRLYGGMLRLPHGWPKYCYDLKQISMLLGDIRFREPVEGKHNALQDALWIRDSFLFLQSEAPYELP